MSESKDCSICCEKTHKSVQCSMCLFSSCIKCYTKYITTCNKDLHCMSCKKIWLWESAIEQLGVKWIKTVFKPHRSNSIFTTMQGLSASIKDEITRENKIKELNQLITIHSNHIKALQQRIDNTRNIERSGLLRSVCSIENCGGYIVSGICTLCLVNVCPKCQEPSSTFGTPHGGRSERNHQCNASLVDSISLLQQECKACPRCRSLTYKENGCDQMFCVSCQAVYSWSTLQLIKGETIHNPHYHELTQQAAREREIGPIAFPHFVISSLSRYIYACRKIHERARKLILIYDHTKDFKKYVLGNEDEEICKQKMFKKEMKQQFNKSIFLILEDFVRKVLQFYYSITSIPEEDYQYEYFVKLYTNYAQDANKQLLHIEKLFNKKTYSYKIELASEVDGISRSS